MEKISALIDKLQELKNSNAGLQSISYYVQLLQAEVLHVRNRQKKEGQTNRESSHVAVIMPASALNDPAPSSSNGYPYHYTQAPVETQKQEPAPITVQAPPPPAEHERFIQKPVSQPVTEHVPAVEHQLYTQRPAPEEKPTEQQPVAPPIAAQAPPAEQEPAPQQPVEVPQPVAQRPVPVPPPPPAPISTEPEKKPAPAMITLFPQTEHTPPRETNGVHKELKELNQRVAQNTTSLNERFRQGHVELADKLGEMPVKDLRHAIGINDKFQFIQELFRGDIDTYERSIKTINEFHSLQEAEYWIERELKIRQGWVDNNRIVKQFYSLVRKRFT